MANKNYSEKLKHPKWQRKRLEIMQRDDFKCKMCYDTETTLHIHHLEYSDGDPWDIENEKLITLCEDCHKIVEDSNEIAKNSKPDDLEAIKILDNDITFIRIKHYIIIRLDNQYCFIDIPYIDSLNEMKERADSYF